MTGGFGWVRDDPDDRDHRYVAPREILRSLPKKADLRPQLPPVYNQHKINSCTANAIAAALEFDEIRQGAGKPQAPSRLFIYYNERAMEGTVGKDTGARTRDGIKVVAKQGDCPEGLWPYRKRNLKVRPPRECYRLARRYKAVEYQRMRHELEELKSCLASGYPFVLGFKAFESFKGGKVRRTGHVRMPKRKEKAIGMHAVLAVGYKDSKGWFIMRNSWGDKWGKGGYFTMPYEYVLDPGLAQDFWTIRVVR
ncbi:MAG: C1 family peptidase [Thaumarchaeota archaeon]|nr:C1 family peptidase [Nitrososphaerota archaeon]